MNLELWEAEQIIEPAQRNIRTITTVQKGVAQFKSNVMPLPSVAQFTID